MTRHILSILFTVCTVSAHAQAIVKENGGNILLLNNNKETIVAANKNASHPVIYGQKVYYLQNRDMNNNGKITSYDLSSGQYADIISTGMKTDNGYTVKSAISNMLADGKNGILYFTTRDVHNTREYSMTWAYNIADGTYKVFSDGKLDNIDGEGNVTVIFEGKDTEGNYTQKGHYTSQRKIISMDSKIYR